MVAHVSAAERHATRGCCRVDYGSVNVLRVVMIRTDKGVEGNYVVTSQTTVSIAGGLDALLPDVYEVSPVT